MNRRPDFTVRTSGTVWVFRAVSDRARHLVDEELELETWQLLPGRHHFAVDHRPARQLAEQLMSNDYTIEEIP